MGHVVDEVRLHLREFLLAEDAVDGEDKDAQHQKTESDGRQNEFRGTQDILVSTGKRTKRKPM